MRMLLLFILFNSGIAAAQQAQRTDSSLFDFWVGE
jgi:hypothetical protein